MKALRAGMAALLVVSFTGTGTLLAQNSQDMPQGQEQRGQSPDIQQQKNSPDRKGSSGHNNGSTSTDQTQGSSSGTTGGGKIQNKKRGRNPQGHGPQRHRPNGES